MKEIQKDQHTNRFPEYDDRHGGAYDRGSADYYYARGRQPHMFMGATYNSAKIESRHMTELELDAYSAGYDDAAATGDRKNWR